MKIYFARSAEKILNVTIEKDINKEETNILRENDISLRAKRRENFGILQIKKTLKFLAPLADTYIHVRILHIQGQDS